MLPERRRAMILEILDSKGSVSVNELHRRLAVSRETIRRDITRLADENKLIKTHGGAMASTSSEPAFAERMAQNVDGKRALGRAAAGLVPDGASVILDSGTTTLCVAEALTVRRGLTVITNDIHIAGKLAGHNDNKVLLLGGEVEPRESATMGRDATAMLAGYFADFAFVGAGAVSIHPWLMDFSREAAELRGMMLAQARVPVVVADYSKLGRTAKVRIANFETCAYLVTDRQPSPDMWRALSSLKMDVLVAAKPS